MGKKYILNRINTEVLIIGAGPAGSVAAGILHQKGKKILMVEKEQFPRFVIGESLLPGCMKPLEEAGMIDDLKQMGFQEKGGALFLRKEEVCDFSFEDQFSDGYNWTWQMPRAEFDKCMTDNLQKRGVDIRFRTAVTHIEFNGSDSVTTLTDADGETYEVAAKFIIDASGYGRVIPRMFNLDKPSDLPSRKTYLAHMTDSKRNDYQQPNRIHAIIQKPDCWTWVIPFSTGKTSVGFVRLPEQFGEYEGTDKEIYKSLVADEPFLQERFSEESFVMEPRTLQGWSVSTDKFYGPGFVLTGNVTEFLDPIFSSGVTLAVISSSRAAALVADTLDGQEVDWERDYKEYMKQGIDVFRTYVMAWYEGDLYKIFFTKNISVKIKSQICSVLAGYVWDLTNPFVRSHKESVRNLVNAIDSGL